MKLWHLALVLVTAAPVAAQAPAITPDGDPSVLADTLYSLAVEPEDYPEEASILLLDDGVVVQNEDGTGHHTYRMIAQVLTRDGVTSWAERTFGYDAKRESFRLNWARVVATDGSLVSDEPVHQQVMDAPVAQASPVYTDQKQVRVSLSGVEPGTIVDVSYTVETIDPVRPGEFTASWLITTGGTVRRSRFLVDVPEGYDLRIDATESTADPVVTRANGRVVYDWSAADLERIEPELFAALDDGDVFQRVQVGAPGSWEDVGGWYADLARDRYEVTDAVRAAARQELGDREGEAALQALHRWVAQDFRYVSISLGLGGYQPRPPEDVLQSRAGDCKDKATLFIALARELGFEAYPVLLSSVGGVLEEIPAIQQFDHAIAAVRIDGRWTFLDLTAELVPFGEIPAGYQGEFGLVVRDDGSVEEVTFGENEPEENETWTRLEGELFEDGRFVGRHTMRQTGFTQLLLRSAFAREWTPKQLDDFANGFAAEVIEGARGDSLEVFDGRDLTHPVKIRLRIEADRATRPNVGGGRIFMLPMESYSQPNVITQLERELETRRFPIDVAQVIGPISAAVELVLTLPEGWRAQLPEDVRAESAFGRYEATYEQDGRELRVVRKMVGAEGVEPPEALPDLIEWLREVSTDDHSFLLIEPPEGVGGQG